MRRRLIVPTLILCIMALSFCIISNTTGSEPQGRYLLLPFAPATYGQYVFACAPKAMMQLAPRYKVALEPQRLCGGRDLLIKTVWGQPGDRIRVDQHDVVRNGARIPLSSSAMPVKPFSLTVPPGALFVGSINPFSFDSRYFGVVHPIGRALPLDIDHTWRARILDWRVSHPTYRS